MRDGCRRLAEVDFPIAVVSRHAVHERAVRHGHPSTVHIWWARRPLASCRAMLLALLLPDPCDSRCPDEFKRQARQLLTRVRGRPGSSDEELQRCLLQFVGDFANWDLSSHPVCVEVARGLVGAARDGQPPLVVDPFAGGGSIPLEALRLGCETFASDLNPVTCLILRTVLDSAGRCGGALVEGLAEAAQRVHANAAAELLPFYPHGADGAEPIAYLWARTVRCESPHCGAEIPLLRSMWLCEKTGRRQAIKASVARAEGRPPEVSLAIYAPTSAAEVGPGTVSRAKAICPCCGAVLAPVRVRAQLREQQGGGDVVFSETGKRVSGARLVAVVSLLPSGGGRQYRDPTSADYDAVRAAQQRLGRLAAAGEQQAVAPDEPLPLMSGTFNVPLYGMTEWGDLFTARQKLALIVLQRHIEAEQCDELTREALALVLDKLADKCTTLCRWLPGAETKSNTFSRQALPMVFDFCETQPLCDSGSSWLHDAASLVEALDGLATQRIGPSTPQVADATESPLPSGCAGVWFTDPPYYFAVPYADLSDFFFVWLKRTLPGHPLLRDPFDAHNPLTPKARELCEMAHWDPARYGHKDRTFYEQGMLRAFSEGRRVLGSNGIGCVVFAHKTTEGWEALLGGLVKAGWSVTASWPIATEMPSRLRARESAALATSIHLVCRPRPDDAPVGDWADVLRELPGRVGTWMSRLQPEGIRGADLVFACIGPALEVYSRYSRVETAEGHEVHLGGDPEAREPHRRGFLAYVWEVIGRAALQQVLETSEVGSEGDAAGALEEDARLTALFLWTVQSTGAGDAQWDTVEPEEGDEDDGDEDEEGPGTSRRRPSGLTLVYDVVRRFAQPLGIHLEEWEGRVIQTSKGVVRLLPVVERARQLFDEDGAQAAAHHSASGPPRHGHQLSLFGTRGDTAATASDSPADSERILTTLDRVHAAMLLQVSGRTSMLRDLLQTEHERGPEFERLANALSALYPRGSEEKRLLDAMLLAVPR